MASVQQTTKTTLRPYCKHCSKRFRTTNTIKKYCSPSCQSQATSKKRRISQIDRAISSAFLYRLASECERAGTLEILRGHTAESLVELHRAYSYNLRVNDFGEANHYVLSHIAPVKGSGSLGLLRADNIVVTLAAMNNTHATTYYGFGASIPRHDVSHKHDVVKGSSRKNTIERIIAYLGHDVVAEAVKLGKITPTRRHTLLLWLREHLPCKDPLQTKLDDMSAKTLATLKATIQGKQETGGFKLMTKEVHVIEVFSSELTRFTKYREDLTELAAFLASCLQRINKREQFLLDPVLLQGLFDLLHGKELSEMVPVLHPALITLASLSKVSIPASLEIVPALEDIPATVQNASMATTVARLSLDGLIEAETAYTLPVLSEGGYVEPESPFD
jgi:hypothetical protein